MHVLLEIRANLLHIAPKTPPLTKEYLYYPRLFILDHRQWTLTVSTDGGRGYQQTEREEEEEEEI